MMKLDRTKFFDGFRARLDATIEQGQVDGLNTILDAIEQNSTWQLDDDIRKAAYALATVFHETAGTFQPIHEYGTANYFNNRYGPNTKVGKDLGNTKAGDGARYAGRGFVQLTGRKNYRKFGIEDTPDDAMKPDVAFRILTDGMFGGSFTGKKFADYIHGQTCDYVGARHIINGQDKAGLIAGYAASFEKILKVSAAAPNAGGSSTANNGQIATQAPSDGQQPPPITSDVTPAPVVAVPAVAAAPTDASDGKPEGELEKIGNKLNALYTSFAAVIAGVIAWFGSMPGQIVLYLVGTIVALGIAYMVINALRANAKDKRDRQDAKDAADREQALKILRETHAQEAQLYSMRTAADPNLQAVTIAQPPPAVELPNSDPGAA